MSWKFARVSVKRTDPQQLMALIRFLHFFRYLTWPTLKQTGLAARDYRLLGLSAEMAYHATLALFPAILAMLTAIGLFGPLQSTLEMLAGQLSRVAPTEVAQLIHIFVQDVSQSHNQGLFSISFLGSLWAASGAISAAMNTFDQIQQTPSRLIRPFWKAKLVSLALTIGTLLLVMIALTLTLVSDQIIETLADRSGTVGIGLFTLWQLLAAPLALGIVSGAIAFIYRYGPSRWHPRTPVLPGAILAAVAWAFLSRGFRLYLSHFGKYNHTYGAIGAIIILLLWLYMSSLVLLVGNLLNVTVGATIRQSSGSTGPLNRIKHPQAHRYQQQQPENRTRQKR